VQVTTTNAADGSAEQGGKSAPVPMDAVWQENGPERMASEPALVVDVDGFEGPLDLLLHLARNQKVDLTQISVLELARQYLVFIEKARALRLELAADYLVMAAWLAFLKSKLLIPNPKVDGEQTGEEMAALLQFRLKRLEAMREAAARLINSNRLGRDVFARGMPEAVIVDTKSEFNASLYDLLTAYAQQRQRDAVTHVEIAKRAVWSLGEARDILRRLIGEMSDWTAIDTFILAYVPSPQMRRTVIASAFAASLEMVRERVVEIRQDGHFGTIYMRDAARTGTET
jgi:segregation and condensation protein A